jgi:hypothetical protein
MEHGRRGTAIIGSLLVLGSVAGLWWTYSAGGICGTPVLFVFFLPFGVLGIVMGAVINIR